VVAAVVGGSVGAAVVGAAVVGGSVGAAVVALVVALLVLVTGVSSVTA